MCVFFLGLNEVDYTHYPDRSFQLVWLRSYLEAYKEYKGQGSEVTDREVEIIYVQVNKFALVSISACSMNYGDVTVTSILWLQKWLNMTVDS